jgi:O-antigen ligase
MKFSLEKINKNLLLVGLALLIFRNNSFSQTFIPKPSTAVLAGGSVIAIVDGVKNKKVKEFILAVPKKIWITLACFFGAIFIGWGSAIFFGHEATTFNMLLEFGNLVISTAAFLLILFYTQQDDRYANQVLYAMLVPVAYTACVLLPGVATHFHLAQDGTFNGFTGNVSIVSTMLLIPTLFFSAATLAQEKNKYLKIAYLLLSAGLVALVFWTAERAAILGLLTSIFIGWILFSTYNFSWKKIASNAGIVVCILGIGFLLVPSVGKKVSLDRMLNLEAHQANYAEVQNDSLEVIVQKSMNDTLVVHAAVPQSSESRIVIWTYYIKRLIKNPQGFGPDTHIAAQISYGQRTYIDPGTHNSYLEAWLWGGIVGMVSFLYILWTAYRNLFAMRLTHHTVSFSLAMILTSLVVAIFFNDSIILEWFWVILALSVRSWNSI